VKNSDIKNFEMHLNNYLNFIRKFNKDINKHSIQNHVLSPVSIESEVSLIDINQINREEEKKSIKTFKIFRKAFKHSFNK